MALTWRDFKLWEDFKGSTEDEFPTSAQLPSEEPPSFYLCMMDGQCKGDGDRDCARRGSVDVPPSDSMDPKLWAKLPDDMVERILLFLPADAQARFQVVRKRWRHLISSPAFRNETGSLCLQTAASTPCFVAAKPMFAEADVLQRSSLSRQMKALRVDLPAPLRTNLQRGQLRTFTWEDGLLVVATVQSCRGCECQCAVKWTQLHIALANPVNRTWMQLPPLAAQGGGFSPRTSLRIVVVQGACASGAGGRSCVERVVVRSESIRCFEDRVGQWRLSEYTAATGAWTSRPAVSCALYMYSAPGRNLLVHGKLYVLDNRMEDVVVLSGRDGSVQGVVQGASEPWYPLADRHPSHKGYDRLLLVHRDSLFLVEVTTEYCALRQLRDGRWMDLGLRMWPHSFVVTMWVLCHATVGGDRIFVSAKNYDAQQAVIAYDIVTAEWTILGRSGYASTFLHWKRPFTSTDFLSVACPMFVPRPGLRLATAF